MLNASSFLETSARENPLKTAVLFGNQCMTYAELNAAANQLASGLREWGVRPRDKIALMSPNDPFFVVAYYGILKAGAAVVPLNPQCKAREVAYQLQDSDAVALIAHEACASEALAGFQGVESCRHLIVIQMDPASELPVNGQEVIPVSRVINRQPSEFDTVQMMPDDTAVILYTSGTTGRPKGAELTHSNIYSNVWVTRDLSGATSEDVFLCVLPMYHSFCECVVMNSAVRVGATMSVLPRFDPDAVLSAMEHDKVTVFAGVPTMYWRLLTYPEASRFDLFSIASYLRIALSAGSAMPVEVLRGFEEKYGVPILEVFGTSETLVACFNHRHRPRKVGSIGTPMWDMELRIVDENDRSLPPGIPGELVIRGPSVMKSYYKRPQETAVAMRGGWFHTGDIARTDRDGYFYIVDRLKDMIIRGGYNVFPREVEEVLLTHPAVSLAAVIGVPDRELGEEVKAFIVLKSGHEVRAEGLIDFCKANMAYFKYPRLIEFCDALPMSATGKILKTNLRD